MTGRRSFGTPMRSITRKDLRPQRPPTDSALLRQATRNARAHEARAARHLTDEERDLAERRAARRAKRATDT